jgi:hypothetical protein
MGLLSLRFFADVIDVIGRDFGPITVIAHPSFAGGFDGDSGE